MSVYAYIGRKPCGCVVAATVDSLEHAEDVAKDLVGWVRRGWAVERLPVTEAGALLKRCKCAPAKTERENAAATPSFDLGGEL